MDERDVRELLTNAADAVVPSSDISARAERRYLTRRARTRSLVGAVVIVVLGSGVATAAIVSRRTTDTLGGPKPRPTTTAPLGVVDPTAIQALSFVGANVGFGLVNDDTPGEAPDLSGVVRTSDGGRTWRRVGELRDIQYGLHFENASDGIAFGAGPLELTTDGGAHWSVVNDAPVDNDVAWAGGRIWRVSPCLLQTCGSSPLRISDDGGVTWRDTAPLQQGSGAAAIAAASKDIAYVVEPAHDRHKNEPQGPLQIGFTIDGGSSWKYAPVPCQSDNPPPALAAGSDGVSLLLVCTDGVKNPAYLSSNRGHTWTNASGLPDGRVSAIGAVADSYFAVGLSGAWKNGPLFGPYPPQWSYQNLPQPVGDVRAIDPVPGVGTYFATASGVWFQSPKDKWDRRAPVLPTNTTSTTFASPVTGGQISSVAFADANNGYGVDGLTSDDLALTTDGGRTWQTGPALPPEARSVMVAPGSSTGHVSLIAWGDASLYESSDGGAHWRATLGPVVQAVAKVSTRLWATVFCGHDTPPCTPRVVTSDDGGRTWTSTPAQIADGSLTIAASSPSTAYVAGENAGMSWTHDGGTSWVHESLPCGGLDIPTLAVNGNALLLICSVGPQETPPPGERAYISLDQGHTWQAAAPIPSADSVFTQAVSATDSGFVVATLPGPLLVTTDDGQSWSEPFPMPPRYGVDGIDREPGLGVWVATSEGIWFSADGTHWKERSPA